MMRPPAVQSRKPVLRKEEEQRKRNAQAQYKRWLMNKELYERAIEALDSVSTDRASNKEQWFEIAVSLAATDALFGISPSEATRPRKGAAGQQPKTLWRAFKQWMVRNGVPLDVAVQERDEPRLLARTLMQAVEHDTPDGPEKRLFIKYDGNTTRQSDEDRAKNAMYLRHLRGLWARAFRTADDRAAHDLDRAAVGGGGESGGAAGDDDEGDDEAAMRREAEALGLGGGGGGEGKEGGGGGGEAKAGESKADGEEATMKRPTAPVLAKQHSRAAAESSRDPNETPRRAKAKEAARRTAALRRIGLGRLLEWVNADQDAVLRSKQREEQERKDEKAKQFSQWVEHRDRSRIRMPPEKAASNPRELVEERQRAKPPRFDFSSRGVARREKDTVAKTSVDMMRSQGFKYIHAPRDREASVQQLTQAGWVVKENYRDEDGDIDEERFTNVKHMARGKRLREQRKAAESKASEEFSKWKAQKERVARATKLLGAIPDPSSVDMPEEDAVGHWQDVGKTLKRVDIWMLPLWTQWSAPFRSAAACEEAWATFRPIVSPSDIETIRRRDAFLALLRRRQIDFKEEFLNACKEKWVRTRRRIAVTEQDDPEAYTSDLPECQEAVEDGEVQLTFHEMRKLLASLAISMPVPEVDHLLHILDCGPSGKLVPLRGEGGGDNLGEGKSDSGSHYSDDGDDADPLAGRPDMGASRREAAKGRKDKQISLKEISRFFQNPPVAAFEQWDDGKRDRALEWLKGAAQEELSRRRQARIVRSGKPPEAPKFLQARVGEDDDPTQTIALRWMPSGRHPVLFYVLEWCGQEGTTQYKTQTYTEVVRDPPTPDAEPDGGTLLHDLSPNASYGLRLRAFNAHGPSPAAHILATTTPARALVPVAVRSAPTSLVMSWSATREEEVLLKRLRKAFLAADRDGSGDVDRAELACLIAENEDLAEMLSQQPASIAAKRGLTLARRLHATRGGLATTDHDQRPESARRPASRVHSRSSRQSLSQSRRLSLGQSRSLSVSGAPRGGAFVSVFDALDLNDDGCLSWDEFRSLFSGALARAASGAKSATSAEADTTHVLVRCVVDGDDGEEYTEVYRGKEPRAKLHGLQPGTPYRFAAYAINRDGMPGDVSDPGLATTALHTPDAPTLGPGHAVSATAVDLRWREPAAASTALLLATRRATSGREAAMMEAAALAPSALLKTGDRDTVLKTWTAGHASNNAVSSARRPSEDTLRSGGRVQGMSVLGADVEGVDVDKLFDTINTDGDTVVSRVELRNFLRTIGAPADDDAVGTMFAQMDLDSDGVVTRPEFAAWFKNAGPSFVLRRDDGQPLIPGIDPCSLPPCRSGLRTVYRGPLTRFLAEGLRPNTVYRFHVRVATPQAQSSLSAPFTVVTLPDQPSQLAAVDCGTRWASLRLYMPPPPPSPRHVSAPSLAQEPVHAAATVEAAAAARYAIQIRHVERMGSSLASGGVGATRREAELRKRGWQNAWEGSEPLAMLANLQPGTVYQARAVAMNSQGGASEPSEPCELVTLGLKSPERLLPSTAEAVFTIECTHDVVLGDTLLFTERLYRLPNGRIVTEGGEKDPMPRNAVQSTRVGADQRPAGAVRHARATGVSALASQGVFLAERTIAASVSRIGAQAASVADRSVASSSVRRARTSTHGSLASRMSGAAATGQGRRILTLLVAWCTVSRQEASDAELVRGTSIQRKERNLFRFEVFRAPWENEAFRLSASEEEDRVAEMEGRLSDPGESRAGAWR